MKKRKITFEIAKLLKDVGYQNGSHNVFIEYHKKFVYDGDPEHHESTKKGEVQFDSDFYTVNNYKDYDMSNKFSTVYESPTHGEICDWLIEKHSIFCNVWPTYQYENKPMWLYFIQDLTDGHNIYSQSGNPFSERYSALETSIIEGLKTIKNKKNEKTKRT